ncbi:MAG: hypothetical protein WC421_03865 [Elusimicrobiales bacterium]
MKKAMLAAAVSAVFAAGAAAQAFIPAGPSGLRFAGPSDDMKPFLEQLRRSSPELYEKAMATSPEDAVSVRVREVPPQVRQGEDMPGLPDGKTSVGDIADAVNQIINTGTQIFKVVVTNKGVVAATNQYANAIPAAATEWDQLTDAQPPVAKSYYMNVTWLGFTVVDATYTIVGVPGMKFMGKGQYLKGVTVMVDGYASWGHKMDIVCQIPKEGIVNAGSADEPVASMNVNVSWAVTTFTSTVMGNNMYVVRGDGQIYNLHHTGSRHGKKMKFNGYGAQ